VSPRAGVEVCKTRSFTQREEHRLRVFENRVQKRMFGPKRRSNRRMEDIITCVLHKLLGSSNQAGLYGWGM